MAILGSGITHRYFGYENCLKDINISIKKDKVTVLYGVTNSGKSTLMSILSGLIKPSCGIVTVDDKAIKDIKPAKLDIALLPYEDCLFRWRSVYSNLKYTLKLRRYSRKDSIKLLNDAIDRFNINGIIYHSVRLLDNALICRVKLARLCLRDAQYYLIDNPFNKLTLSERIEMFNRYYKDILSLKGGILYATDSLAEAAKINGYTYFIDSGRIIAEGSYDSIVDNISNIATATLLKDDYFNIYNSVEYSRLDNLGLITGSISLDDNLSIVIPYDKVKIADYGIRVRIKSIMRRTCGYLIEVNASDIPIKLITKQAYNIDDEINIAVDSGNLIIL